MRTESPFFSFRGKNGIECLFNEVAVNLQKYLRSVYKKIYVNGRVD
jgi:hypothetical protein